MKKNSKDKKIISVSGGSRPNKALHVRRGRICGIVLALLTAAVLISAAAGFLKWRGKKDAAAPLPIRSAPTLPHVSFLAEGREINTLAGYTAAMDVAALRDTITPVSGDGILTAIVKDMSPNFVKLDYEVYSLNGERLIWRGSSDLKKDGTALLDLKDALPGKDAADNDRERVLNVILEFGEGEEKIRACYYTRIISDRDLHIKQCMDFAEDFHYRTFDKGEAKKLNTYLEPDAGADNHTLAHVTIHSNIDQVMWGKMNLNVTDPVCWRITETNPVYTSLQAVYRVKGEGTDGGAGYLNVREFFRVRYLDDRMYLLNYDRSMTEIFTPREAALTDKGILLGIAPKDIAYMASPGGKAAAFVSQGSLWVFDREAAKLCLAFGFADRRIFLRDYDVRIIEVEENGNTAFAVNGYMDRGEHEGEVGAAVYYFDTEKNTAEEKLFIPSSKSDAIAAHELGEILYYAHDREILYMISGGKLFEIDLEENTAKILNADFPGEYIVSGGRRFLAYGEGGGKDAAQAAVMDLMSGKTNFIKAPAGEKISLSGFIKNDIIYGLKRAQDKGKTEDGKEIIPSYKLEITDEKGNVAKEYSAENIYISGTEIEQNFVIVHRARKDGGVYKKYEDDYITDDKEREGHGVGLKAFYKEPGQRQMILTIPGGCHRKSLKSSRALLIPDDKNISFSFEESLSEGEIYYVYALGEMRGIYSNAAAAIRAADAECGVVTAKDQTYIWERGNRDIIYYTDTPGFTAKARESGRAACERALKSRGGRVTDLTGCTLKQMYYIINRYAPVIMMTDAEHAVLITGYSTINLEYIDPADGERHYADNDKMEEMAKRGGNVFLGELGR